MNKKTILYLVLPIAFGGAYIAMAQEDTTGILAIPTVVSEPVTAVAPAPPVEGTQAINIAPPPQQDEKQMILEVGPEGKVLLRGIISSVSSGVITVKGWGGVWTVNVPATAQILPESVKKDITLFKVGDYVGVQGRVLTSASWTINASVVRDRTRETMKPLKQEQKQEVKNQQKEGKPQGEQGQNRQEGMNVGQEPKPQTQGVPQRMQNIFSNFKTKIGQIIRPQQAPQPTPIVPTTSQPVSPATPETTTVSQ